MSNFRYDLISVCSRAGKEFFHVYPHGDYHFNLDKDFLVSKVGGYYVTVFPSGRMLIESLPEGSINLARTIVEKIASKWL